MTRVPLRAALFFLAIALRTFPSPAQVDAGSDDAITLGMSTALTGPAAELGINMREGILAALAEANRSGGIHGRPLRLVSLDDGYEPARTVPNMHRLINEYEVLAVIGNVGTPTAVVAVPIANAAKVPFFGAFTGAGVLRKERPDRYVINYRASYSDETAAMVEALIAYGGLKPEEVAFFTQRDAYGDAGYVGGIAALREHGLEHEDQIAHGRYDRNTEAVENALADILMAPTPPKAVIMVGAYRPCAAFIRLAKRYELDVLFLNVSFVGAAPLAKALGTDGEGVIVTQVVPHPQADLPLVREYHKALVGLNSNATPTFGSLEGYIDGRILIRALNTIEPPITRESVVDALDSLGQFDIGIGSTLNLSRDDHGACHQVWPTIIRDGDLVSLDWTELDHQK